MPWIKLRPNDRNIEGNISQHCWVQHVARLATVLRHVATYWVFKFELVPAHSHSHEPVQTTTISCNVHKCCMKNLTTFKFEPATPYMSQHVAIGWPNALRPTMLRDFVLRCCDLVWPAGLKIGSSNSFASTGTYISCYIFRNSPW